MSVLVKNQGGNMPVQQMSFSKQGRKKDGKWVFHAETVDIVRVGNHRYRGSGCHFATGFSADGRKFCIGSRTGINTSCPWNIEYEVFQFRPIFDGNGEIDLKSIVCEFIISQYRDGEKIVPVWAREDLCNAESAGTSRWKRFQEIYPRISWEDIEEVAEEVLIDLFCETEDANRILIEENGVFCWKTR
jgi:hypothetical protein